MLKWNPANKKYYINLGYPFTKMKDEFKVKVEDLSKGSHSRVEVLCDYCLEEGRETVISKEYREYLKEKFIIHKDCCKKCYPKKVIESNLLVYDIEYPMLLEEFKERKKETILDRYGKEYYSQTEEYLERVIKTNQEKYNCDWALQNEDIRIKVKQTCLDKYGVENYSQTEEYKEKVKQTNLDRYGVEYSSQNKLIYNKIIKTNLENYGEECYFQTDEFKNKSKQTCQEKYGCDYPMQNKDIKNKLINILYKNGTARKSKQQEYLCSLLNGELNYPVSNCLLDIAYLDEKIYIEYDGGGHDLCVKLGNMTQENFDRNEIKRYYFLCNKGWKEIRIISRYDYLPSDDKIIEIITYAKDYLNLGYSWIKFDIDNQLVKCNQYEKDYNFGILRKVKNII